MIISPEYLYVIPDTDRQDGVRAAFFPSTAR
jgi:hypothetical protein